MRQTTGARVITLFMVGGLALFFAIGLVGYNVVSTPLRDQAVNQLTSVREMKKAELERFIENRMIDIKTLSANKSTLYTLEAFMAAFKDTGPEKVRELYIFNNPYPMCQKLDLSDAQDDSAYTRIHTRYHPVLKNYLEEFKCFYDLFLVDAETGDIVYTVYKEDDFGTNLYDGKYRDSGLAELARTVNASHNTDVLWTDFKTYAPSNSEPARFVASPVINEVGEKVGILILQLSIDAVDAILSERNCLGESGEVYLVGPDKIMRSNSRFSGESTALKSEVDTFTVQEALKNRLGTKVIEDYRGVPVLTAYSPVDVGGMTWAILAEVDEAEALAAAASLRYRRVITGVGIVLGVVALGYLVTRFAGRVAKLLKGMIQKLSGSSASIAPASGHVYASNHSPSPGTKALAASVEEILASLEVMEPRNTGNTRGAVAAGEEELTSQSQMLSDLVSSVIDGAGYADSDVNSKNQHARAPYEPGPDTRKTVSPRKTDQGVTRRKEHARTNMELFAKEVERILSK